MLNLQEGVHRIRAVVKDSEGFTRIYKTAYDAKIAPESQCDTLAPIINAIGMNLYDTIGPAEGKLNIVTEGMSDYIFLSTMAKKLELDISKYTIIPSVGVTNCIHICSILHGWGCQFVAIFDFDKEGVEKGGEVLQKDMLYEMGKQFLYIKDVSQEDIESKSYKTNKYMIEDLVLRSEIDRFCDEQKISSTLGKVLMAKIMCDAIEEGSFIPSEECIDNFRRLFARIFLCT